MPNADFESWRSELIQKGRIPSDDEAVDRHAAARDCLRYVELVGMVRGTEGIIGFEALLESMQVEEDYEVYETTISALQRFPGEIAGDRDTVVERYAGQEVALDRARGCDDGNRYHRCTRRFGLGVDQRCGFCCGVWS